MAPARNTATLPRAVHGGETRASHVPDVTAKTLGAALKKAADRRSALQTDGSLANQSVGKDFGESTSSLSGRP